MRRLLITVFLGLTCLASQAFAGAEMSQRLLDEMSQATENNAPVRALVMLNDQVDVNTLSQQLYDQEATLQLRAYTIITALQEKAASTQGNLLSILESRSSEEVLQYESYWVVNALFVEAVPEVINQLADELEVDYIDLDSELEWDRPVARGPAAEVIPNGVEPGLLAINADAMWAAGYTGNGVIVMNIDTGVDVNHPALGYKWRGNQPGVPASAAWIDPGGGTTMPNDCDDHGTHTIGIMNGLDPATNDTIGVAPGAQWIAAKTICSSPHTSNTLAAFQWAMDPDGDPGTSDDMPVGIGNSYFDPNVGFCDATYQAMYDAVEASGIGVVFSAGNSGPGSGSITTPKNHNADLVNTFATGALDANNVIASFSSRGPSQCVTGDPRLDTKPEASAPGVSVRSSVIGGGYSNFSGTSMACPHVVGAMALLREAHPNKTGEELKLALYETAVDLGTTGEDNTYGMGIIDVFAAHLSLADPEDPNDPENFTAYSDYTTPSSILLTWTDPTTLVSGDTLTNFEIEVWRDGDSLTVVASGVESYVDNNSAVEGTGLNDGQLYMYTIFAKDLNTDSLSQGVDAEAYAGGAGMPDPPAGFFITTSGSDLVMHWTNPSTQIDGTPLDDLAGVKLYEDGAEVMDYVRSNSDSGSVDSAVYSPPGGTHSYYVTVYDDEIPSNESDPSNTAFSPIDIPFFDDFPTAGPPNPGFWINSEAEVNGNADNPPSPPNSLNLNGFTSGGDLVTLLPVDLSGLADSGVALQYSWQPQGNGELPDAGDSLIVEALNSLGNWRQIVGYNGRANQPFTENLHFLDAVPAGSGATWFYPAFQFRFRSVGTSSATTPFDDWFIDDVFLGIFDAAPQPPSGFAVNALAGDTLEMSWTNPTKNEDLTVLTDFSGIRLYEDGVEVASFVRTPADTGMSDSELYVSGGTHTYFVRAEDSNGNLSNPSDIGATPIAIPFFDQFVSAGDPNTAFWFNNDAEVNADGDNEPSAPNSLDLDGSIGGDDVSLVPVDISALQDSGLIISYWYQPQGTVNAPESTDSFFVELKNDLGAWRTVRRFGGMTVVPYINDVISIDAESAGSGTFFHGTFQFRFRTASSPTGNFDDWFVDDVFFGLPNNDPIMTVSETVLTDTNLVGAPANTKTFEIDNGQILPSVLNFTVTIDPVVGWLSANPTAGAVSSADDPVAVEVTFDPSTIGVGVHNTSIIVDGNDPANPSDTIAVTLVVNDPPVVFLSDTLLMETLNEGDTTTSSFWIHNLGVSDLEFSIIESESPVSGLVPGNTTEEPVSGNLISGVGSVDEEKLTNKTLENGVSGVGVKSATRSTQSGAVAGSLKKGGGAAASQGNAEVDPSGVSRGIAGPGQIEGLGDKLMAIGLPPITGATSHLGVEFALDHFFVTSSEIGAPPNWIHKLDVNGALVTSFSQPTSSWGWRDLAWDGQFLYGSVTPSVEQIDPATGQPTGVTIPGPENPNRALAYDPAADHFYTQNFSNDLFEFDRSGNVIRTIPNPLAPLGQGAYGAAWDDVTPGGPYLWLNSGVFTGDTHFMAQVDPVSGTLTGLQFTGTTDNIAGGLALTGEMSSFPNQLVMVAIGQSDTLSVWDMDQQLGLDWADVSPTNGSVSSGDSVEVTVSWYGNLPTSEVTREGYLGIQTNDPSTPVSNVHLVVDILTGIGDVTETLVPESYKLHQNFPNPFNPKTTIKYDLPESGKVEVKIYNILGQEVRTLVNTQQEAGFQTIQWDGKNNAGRTVSSGIYVYRLVAGKYVSSKKMMFLK